MLTNADSPRLSFEAGCLRSFHLQCAYVSNVLISLHFSVNIITISTFCNGTKWKRSRNILSIDFNFTTIIGLQFMKNLENGNVNIINPHMFTKILGYNKTKNSNLLTSLLKTSHYFDDYLIIVHCLKSE